MVDLPPSIFETSANPTWYARDVQFNIDLLGQNLTAFDRLFRYYRIRKVEVFFKPVQIAPAPAGGNNFNGMATSMYSAIVVNGEDLATVWQTEQNAQQNSNVKLRYFGNTLSANKAIYKRTLYPRVNNAIFADVNDPAGFVNPIATQPATKDWLTIKQSGNAMHYGLKVGWAFDQGNPEMEVHVMCRYELEFKGVQ